MTNDLHDPQLVAWLLDADPADVAALREVASSDAAEALRDDITRHDRPARRRGRRLAALASAALVAAATVGVVSLLAPPSTQSSAYAASAVHFARQSPRLLIGQPGWRVTDLNQEYADQGVMTFTAGTRTLDVDWNSPANAFAPITGRNGQLTAARTLTIDGHRALAGPESGPPATGAPYFSAYWSVGNLGLQVRGRSANLDQFIAVVRTMHRASVSTFLAALPPTVVTAEGRRSAVAAMLADIPQPDRFSSAKLDSSTLLLDRYQLGARVTTAVSCSWLGRYLHGNRQERTQASAAMATSRRWAILREMAPQGGYSQALWESADNMNGVPIRGMTADETVPEILKNHLGC